MTPMRKNSSWTRQPKYKWCSSAMATILLILFMSTSLFAAKLAGDFTSIKDVSFRGLRWFARENLKMNPAELKVRVNEWDSSIPVDSPEYDKVLLLKLYTAYYSNDFKKTFSILSEMDRRIGKGGFDISDLASATRYVWLMTFFNAGKEAEGLLLLTRWRKALNSSERKYLTYKIDFNILRIAIRLGKYEVAMDALERVADYNLNKPNPRWSFAYYYRDFNPISAALKDKSKALALLKRLRALGIAHGRPLFALLADKRLALLRRLADSQKKIDTFATMRWLSDVAEAKKDPAYMYKPLLILHRTLNDEDLTDKEKDVLEILPSLLDDDFIAVKDSNSAFKNKACLEIVQKDGNVSSILLDSATIPDLMKFIDKGLLVFHKKSTLPSAMKSDAYSLKYLGKTYELSDRNKLAELFFRKFLELIPNNHQRIITKRDMVHFGKTKRERVKRLSEVLPEALAAVDECVQCPMYIYVNLLRETSGTPNARKWLDEATKFEKRFANRNKAMKDYFNIYRTKEKLHQLLLTGDNRATTDFTKKLYTSLIAQRDSWLKGCFLSQMALLLSEFKWYDAAIDFNQAAARAYENSGYLSDSAQFYHNLGVQYLNTGMREKSKDAYEKALRLGLVLNDKHRIGDVLRGLSDLTDDSDEAIRMLEKSRTFLFAAREFPCLINTMRELVRKQAEMGRFKESERSLEKLERISNLWGKPNSYFNAKAYLLIKEKKYDQAAKLIETILSKKGDALSPRVRCNFQEMIGDARNDAKLYSEALTWYEKVISTIENSRTLFSTQERKSAFSSIVFDTYAKAFDCAYSGSDRGKAFEIMERGRARAFLDLLSEKMRKGKIGISHGFEKKNQSQSVTRKTPENPLLAVVGAADTSNLPRDLEVVVKNPPIALNSFISAKPVSLDEFQKSIAEDVTVIEYFTTAEKLYIWTIDSKDKHLTSVDLEYGKLKEMVDVWREQIRTSPIIGAPSDMEKKLYGVLWDSIANLVNNRRIIIIPHRILHSMPFHALRDDKGDFLCETREITRASSATVLKMMDARRRTSNKMLAFGNPFIETGLSLPHSEKEAENAASYFNSELFLRDKATETSFKANSPQAGIIHLACHAFFDKYSPLDSFVLLTRDSRNDGMLKTTEIFNLSLPKHPLVVLSACKSAKGSMTDGDDLIGLSSAFFCAGASQIVATLWSVSDQATEHVMRSFYRHFAESGNASESLTALRRDMIKERRPMKDWAPFILIGGVGGQEKNNKN